MMLGRCFDAVSTLFGHCFQALLEGDEGRFGEFKSISQGLQKGSVGGKEYHRAFAQVFGRGAEAHRLFKELVVLLPVKAKQDMLRPFCN